MTATAQQPLAGLEIIELSTMITCSLAAMMMRAQGARIIKVEPVLVGDPLRLFGSQKNGISALFHNSNRGKQGLAIDLKSEAGAEAVRRLASRADILLTNYRPGVMDKLGLGSAALRQLNPRLINVAVTGFGTVGPMCDRPAYDHVIQGIAGFTDLQGANKPDEGETFEFIRMLICDKLTAYTVAQAATAALVARASTGEGQHIDISMLHACLAFMWPDGMMNHTLHDDDVVTLPPMSDYYQTVNAKDGAVAAAPVSDEHWRAILSLVEREELLDDPRYATIQGRVANMGAVVGMLKDAAQHLTVDKIMQAFVAADIPCAPCNRRADLSTDAQIQAIGALETYVTENLGRLTTTTPAALFSGMATSLAEPAPALGEHSRQIMQELGWDNAAIDQFIEQGNLLCASGHN